MTTHFPICRMGWREAFQNIQAGTYKLRKYKDGHAEILTNPRWDRDDYADCVVAFLTCRSVELLEAALREKK